MEWAAFNMLKKRVLFGRYLSVDHFSAKPSDEKKKAQVRKYQAVVAEKYKLLVLHQESMAAHLTILKMWNKR
ncbi:hypothetical protein OAM67_00105 [bacterium]|nr:hypothetical protein [bacterium]